MTADGFQKTVLPSGVTVVSETMPDRRSVAAGVWVRCGSRDEPAELLGISHFLEHMVFKGTERRDARAIAASLESLGGHLDAFTAREEVCYYARALAEHLPDAIDVLADIASRPLLAPHEVDREKSVVREEIFSCEDNPEDKINDLLSEQVWGGHALGRPILGTVETVDRISSESLRGFFSRRYRGEALVVAASGGLDHAQLVALVDEHLKPCDGEPMALSEPPPPFAPSLFHEARADLQQLYLALGTRGVGFGDPRRYPLVVLNTLLGAGMSSRLFQSVREEAGLAYSVFSAADFHRDAGLLSVQLGVAPERGREALQRVREELEALVENGPTEDEVASARSQLKGTILMAQESVSSRMSHIAHEEIYRGGYTTREDQVARVLAVTRDQVVEAAREFLRPERFVLTAIGPASGGPLTEADWPIDHASGTATAEPTFSRHALRSSRRKGTKLEDPTNTLGSVGDAAAAKPQGPAKPAN
ncbi:MAG TPA: pitrilysin family protein [Candidatus Eisenbacteria bacterium]|nr:pitrilysin family protein [Candidatus Eisenbacteria bacterium]